MSTKAEILNEFPCFERQGKSRYTMCLDIVYKGITDLYCIQLSNKSEMQQQKVSLQSLVYGKSGFLLLNQKS